MSSKLTTYLMHLGVAVVAVFAPIKSMILTVLVFTLADLITGVWAALKRKELLTSLGLRRTVGKLLVYQTALIFAYLLEHFLLDDLPITKIVAGTIGITEFKSLLENLGSITGQPIVKLLIDRVSGVDPSKSE